MEGRPFLSILTRCSPYRAARFLERNRASVAEQTDQDIEHVLIEGGRNFAEAIRSVAKAKSLLSGRYVLILDDDNFLCDDEAVAKLRAAAGEGAPDVIMIQSKVYGGFRPHKKAWKKKPVKGWVGAENYVVKLEVWKKHIKAYSRADWGGDFRFIEKLWDEGYKFARLEGVMVGAEHIGALDDHKERRREGK